MPRDFSRTSFGFLHLFAEFKYYQAELTSHRLIHTWEIGLCEESTVSNNDYFKLIKWGLNGLATRQILWQKQRKKKKKFCFDILLY